MMKQLMNNRWMVLVVSCWIQILNSPIYLFNTYSQPMKLSLNLDQTTLTRISTCTSLGVALSLITGYLYTVLPSWVLLFTGTSFQSLALFLVWLTMVHKLQGGAWHLCLYHMILGLSLSFNETPLLMTNALNFPTRTASVAGLLKGYFVLGASVLLQIFYLASAPEDLINLPRTLSWLVALILLGMFSLRRFPVSPVATYKRQLPNLFIMSTCLIALSLSLMLANVLDIYMTFTHSARVLVAVFALIFLLSLIGPALRAETTICTELDNDDFQQPLLVPNSSSATAIKEYSLGQALRSLSFWMLFMAAMCGFGTVHSLQNNIAQFANSLGYTQKTASICVSVICICSCWGRIGAGLLSDYCVERFQTPRTVMLSLAMVVSFVSMVVAAVPVRGGLFISTVLNGLVEGALWSLFFAATSDMFGSRSLSMIYNVLLTANWIGTYGLSSVVVGYLYDKAAGRSLLCHGGHCFRTGFLVSGGVSLAGACICALLTKR